MHVPENIVLPSVGRVDGVGEDAVIGVNVALTAPLRTQRTRARYCEEDRGERRLRGKECQERETNGGNSTSNRLREIGERDGRLIGPNWNIVHAHNRFNAPKKERNY